MAKANNKLSKTINPKEARQLWIDAALIRAYLADASEAIASAEFESLLVKSQINPAALDAPGARIPFDKVSKVLNRVRVHMADEEFGWLERPVAAGFFRLTVLAAIQTDSLLEALERILEYRNVAGRCLHHSIANQGSQVVVELAQQSGNKVVSHGAIDFYLSGIVRILSWLGNRALVPTIVRLTFRPPAYVEEYRYLYYGASVLFGQTSNSVSFDREALAGRVVQNEASLQRYLLQAPRDLFFPRYMIGSTTETVREKLSDELLRTRRASTLEDIASALRCGPQTLRRRLLGEGSNFHDIKLQVRRDLAIHLISREGLGVESIAEAVGYTESSNFVRAFKGWTGMTPKQFQRRV